MKYCRNCGKQIDDDSTFCTHCGFTLNSSSDTDLWAKLKNNQRIGIVITGLWMLTQLCFFVSEPLEKGNKDETLWFFESDFLDFYAYGLGELSFYGLLVPALIWSVVYIFSKNRKVGHGLFIGLAALVLIFCGTAKYNEYKKEHIITREFISCKLGDDYSSVLQKVKKEYNNCIDNKLTDKESIVLSKVSYGPYIYDKIRFFFYNEKLYQVEFCISFTTEDNKLSGYEKFHEILEQKNYPHDTTKYKKYNNSFYYSDKHTELMLRHSVYEYDNDEQYVQLNYYDLNSHKKDEGL